MRKKAIHIYRRALCGLPLRLYAALVYNHQQEANASLSARMSVQNLFVKFGTISILAEDFEKKIIHFLNFIVHSCLVMFRPPGWILYGVQGFSVVVL